MERFLKLLTSGDRDLTSVITIEHWQSTCSERRGRRPIYVVFECPHYCTYLLQTFPVPRHAGALSGAPRQWRLGPDTRYPAGPYERSQDGAHNS